MAIVDILAIQPQVITRDLRSKYLLLAGAPKIGKTEFCTMAPDALVYLTNPILDGCTVYNYETGKTTGIYDMDQLAGDDPYEVFLSGAAALLTIENPACTDGRELVVFRDSFGSSIVPLLAGAYSKITLVDIRYVDSNYLPNLVDLSTADDVLFLYSAMILNQSTMLK